MQKAKIISATPPPRSVMSHSYPCVHFPFCTMLHGAGADRQQLGEQQIPGTSCGNHDAGGARFCFVVRQSGSAALPRQLSSCHPPAPKGIFFAAQIFLSVYL